MKPARATILITGFGPFPGVPHNISAALADAIGTGIRRRFPTMQVVTHALATEWDIAPEETAMLIVRHKPRLAVHLGVSNLATGFVVETLARNAADRVDAAGVSPQLPFVDPLGPNQMPTGLPAGRITSRLQKLGLPARLSRDAGTYLCNAVFYRSVLTQREIGKGGRSGFVHLPVDLAPSRTPQRRSPANKHQNTGLGSLRRAIEPGFDFEKARRGGIEIVTASLNQHT